MFTTITLYNNYHNGDIFVCKQFVQSLIKQCPDLNFVYHHFNHPKITQDLNIGYSSDLSRFNDRMKYMINPGEIAVNTWVGAYEPPHVQPPAFFKGGINLFLLHEIWSYLFENLSVFLNRKLVLSSNVEDFFPTIDYNCFDVSSVDCFVKNHNNIVLFSNGAAMSGQSFASNMSEIIELFAECYPNLTFVCTAKFQTNKTNVFFTDDIIKVESGFPTTNLYWNQNLTRSDINEISYLSRFCKLIVGKNSGPFIYCLTKENLLDPAKTFISFNNKIVDSLVYNIQPPCTYTQCTNFDPAQVATVINNHLCLL